jgi:cysteine-rich repeat protein
LCGDESCDDGYVDACGSCNADCTGAGSDATCGDGVVCPELEPCDDGAATASCDTDCTVPECGDGLHNTAAGEACDDGNTDSCDGDCLGDCSAAVTLTGCGDGVVCGAEACDDSGESATCDDDCTVAECGDNALNVTASEVCDDGNTDSCLGDCLGDCSATVTLSGCGDGAVCNAEVCDDGNVADGDYCAADCLAITGSCGDGAIIAALEDCDDGNTAAGDGCDDLCQPEDDDLVCEGEPSLCAYPVVRDLVSTNGTTVCSVPAGGGAVSCWGDNNGELASPPTGTFTEVLVGSDAACGLRDDAQVVCWGSGAYPTPSLSFVQMTENSGRWCGLTDAEEIACWGPSPPTPPTGPFSRISFLDYYERICVVHADGAASCSLVDDDVLETPTGAFVDVAGGRVELTAGEGARLTACWLGAAGRAACDSVYDDPFTLNNRYRKLVVEPADYSGKLCGLLTDGTTDCNAQLPASEVPTGPWGALSAATVYDDAISQTVPLVCGQSETDETRCWGPDWSDLTVPPAEFLGDSIVMGGDRALCTLDGDALRCLRSTNAPSGASYADVSLGWNAACGLRLDGSLQCWGDNTYQLATAPSGTFLDVAVSGQQACAIRDDGSLHCWGDDANGRIDAPTTGEYVEVQVSDNRSCAMDMTDTLTCWGYNPGARSAAWKDWTLTKGDGEVCAVRASDSAVRCWYDLSDTPESPVMGAFDAIVASESYNGCGLKPDKTLECWGNSITPPAGSYTDIAGSYSTLCAVEDVTRQVRCVGQLVR